MNKTLRLYTCIAILCFSAAILLAYCTDAKAQEGATAEVLMLEGVGYYRFVDDPNKLDLELNTALTPRDKGVNNVNSKEFTSIVTPEGAEFLKRLMKNDDFVGFVGVHRRLILTKYNSASWESLLKYVQTTYSKAGLK